VPQSAVTKSIADLKQRIGFPIFYRTSRGTILTEKGLLIDLLKRMLGETDTLATLVQRPGQG
jgi:DNA-binding transcriptional LysR family regulator